MSDFVRQYLERKGPALSSDVSDHLISLGMTAVAARKAVSRATGDIRKLGYIDFPRRARFIYLQQQFGSPTYWINLIDALLRTRSAYGYAIAALQLRDGLMPSAYFPIACGAPVRQSKHLAPETVYEKLEQAGLLRKVQVEGLGECISLIQSDGYYDETASSTRARLITEDLLLTAVGDWARNLGIVSYGAVVTRSPERLPRVGTFAWDLTAPSYLGFMVKQTAQGNPKPGFFVCDVHLGTVDEQGVMPFVRKCVTLRQLKNVGPCMQVFVAQRFTAAAHRILKQNGIIPATPRTLFGRDVAEGLAQLTKVLERSTLLSIEPGELEDIFQKFAKLKGAQNQLRGALFEFIAADLARRTISPQIRMNQVYHGVDGKAAEADVVAVVDNQSVTFVECKGYNPYGELPAEEFSLWLEKRVPIFFDAIKKHPDWKNLKIRFELWSTAPLTDESTHLYETMKSKIRPARYTIAVRLGNELQNMCYGTKDKPLLSCFRRFFTKRGRRMSEAELDNFDEDAMVS